VTPLRQARKANGWTLDELASRLEQSGAPTDSGNLSRLERGKQSASTVLAEALAKVFGKRRLTEMQVLYPERYTHPE
jgi:transcriptional regulator with XRE-family HTH domain